MDADRVTFACATKAERRAARRAGLPAALVGMRAANGVPDGPVISFGLAGGLRDDLGPGTVVDAVRVVDGEGAVLWEGGPLGLAAAETVTVLAADEIVDDPAQRRLLRERTGADVADLESGPIARAGRLTGVARAIADTPSRPLDGLAAGVKPDGGYDWPALLSAFARAPRSSLKTAADARCALRALRRSVGRWSS